MYVIAFALFFHDEILAKINGRKSISENHQQKFLNIQIVNAIGILWRYCKSFAQFV